MRLTGTENNAAAIDIAPFLTLIREKAGLTFSDCNHNGIRRSIEEGMQQHKEDSRSFRNRLEHDEEAFIDFISDVTITETYFFREEKHFFELKRIIQKRSCATSLRCWSVTASSGEEAYSIAMLLEALDKPRYTVFASDINVHVLEQLKQARYRDKSLRSDGRSFHYLLEQYSDRQDQYRTVDKMIRNKIETHHLNLNDAGTWPVAYGMDIVFFRNTLIYMPIEIKKRVLKRVCEKIVPGGHLFLGTSEVATCDIPGFTLQEIQEGGFYLKKEAHIPYTSEEIKAFGTL